MGRRPKGQAPLEPQPPGSHRRCSRGTHSSSCCGRGTAWSGPARRRTCPGWPASAPRTCGRAGAGSGQGLGGRCGCYLQSPASFPPAPAVATVPKVCSPACWPPDDSQEKGSVCQSLWETLHGPAVLPRHPAWRRAGPDGPLPSLLIAGGSVRPPVDTPPTPLPAVPTHCVPPPEPLRMHAGSHRETPAPSHPGR